MDFISPTGAEKDLATCEEKSWDCDRGESCAASHMR